METLIHSGANLDIQNGYGITALHIVADLGLKGLVLLLLEKGAKNDLKTKQGQTAFDCAKDREHHSVLAIAELRPADVPELPLLYHNVEITIHSARNLRAADLNGFSDPYVVVSTGTQEGKTPVIKKELNPSWNSEFSFFCLQEGAELLFRVWDKDLISDDFLGQVIVPITSFESSVYRWHPLTSRPGKSDKIAGDICISINYSPVFKTK